MERGLVYPEAKTKVNVNVNSTKSSFFSSFNHGKIHAKGSSSSSSPSTAFISGPGAKARSEREKEREAAERDRGATSTSTSSRKNIIPSSNTTTTSSPTKPKNKALGVRRSRPKSPANTYVAPSSFPIDALLAARDIATRPLPTPTPSPPKRSSQSVPQLSNRAKYPGPSSSQTSVHNGRGDNHPTPSYSSASQAKPKSTKQPSGSSHIKTKIKANNKRRTSPSGSEDELSLGSTPIQHQHQAYREGSQDIGSPIPKPKYKSQSRKSAAQTANSSFNDTKRNDNRVLIAASSDDLLGNHDTPRQKHGSRSIQERDQNKKKKKTKNRYSDDESTSGSDSDLLPTKKRVSSSQGSMNKNRKRTTIIGDSDDDKEEVTPRPKGKLKNKDNGASRDHSNDKRKKDVGDDEANRAARRISGSSSPSRRTSGARFFAQLSKYSSDNEVDYGLLNADVSEVIEQPPELDHDDLSIEDNAYLATFKNKDNLCPYCSEAMPKEPSDHLKRLQAKLEAISIPRPTASNPAARQLSWQQSVVFCSLHRAEAIVIPLGIRDGFPNNIDFDHMQDRMEKGWIREYLDELARDPHKSRVFQGVISEVERIGKLQWGGIHHQSNEDMLQSVMPGYYGELGRTIIVDHFILLLRWGYLPTLKPTPDGGNPNVIDPLSTKDFFSHVLVPEASILLIMSDRGSEKYTEKAYIEAERVREKSVAYGRWSFREDDERGKRVLGELHGLRGKEEKKERLREIKREKKGERDCRKGKKVKVKLDKDDDEEENKENGNGKVNLQRENTTSTESIIVLDSAPSSTSRTKSKSNGRKRKATTPLGPTTSQASNDNDDERESIWGEDLPEDVFDRY